MLHSAAFPFARPGLTRALLLVVAAAAVTFGVSAASLAAPATALAQPAPISAQSASAGVAQLAAESRRAPAATAPKRAVVVVGPVASQTAEYVNYAKQVAASLTAAGVHVDLILPPHATWAAVSAAANGADFVAYLGHGSGSPSRYTDNGEETHDGVGLDPKDGDTNYSHVQYYGANYLSGGYHCTLGVPTPATRADCLKIRYGVWKDYGRGIHLASDAIVLLNHLCYASGNAEPGMALPTQTVAIQRADNYAYGWLAAGARVVFALSWQPGQDITNWLAKKHITMDAMFQLRDTKNGSGSYMPFHGWVGYLPNLYFQSARTPGARVHLDPDLAPAHKNGWLRAVAGDLNFTTDAWWAATN